MAKKTRKRTAEEIRDDGESPEQAEARRAAAVTAEVERILRDLLKQAKRGEITGIAIAATGPDLSQQCHLAIGARNIAGRLLLRGLVMHLNDGLGDLGWQYGSKRATE